MNILIAVLLFLPGLALVIYSAERLVRGAVGTALGFGVSTFLISVIFIGFDPENLFVGISGSIEGVSGIAVGSIIGATMVAIALAFGVTALIAPMTFEKAPWQVLIVSPLAVILFGGLVLDGFVSRIDGIILFMGFIASVLYLLWLSKRGLSIKPHGDVAETLEKAEEQNRWRSLGILVLSLAAIIVGSEMLVTGSETIIARLGISDTFFGLIILAFLVSIEELARELPAAIRGRPEISFGNVVGSILAFFLFNAGTIAMVSPFAVSNQVLVFYPPVCFVTVIVVSVFVAIRSISRWAGAVLVLLYVIFATGGYLLGSRVI